MPVPRNIPSDIIKASNIPALKNDPVKTILSAAQIPEKYHEEFLVALKIEAEATNKTACCNRRECRRSGQCHAEHFNGIDHPCGVDWQMETLQSVMMMQVFHLHMQASGNEAVNLADLVWLNAR